MNSFLLLSGGMNIPIDVSAYEAIAKSMADDARVVVFRDTNHVEYTVATKVIIGMSKEYPKIKL
jgi:hypothetical protein